MFGCVSSAQFSFIFSASQKKNYIHTWQHIHWLAFQFSDLRFIFFSFFTASFLFNSPLPSHPFWVEAEYAVFFYDKIHCLNPSISIIWCANLEIYCKYTYMGYNITIYVCDLCKLLLLLLYNIFKQQQPKKATAIEWSEEKQQQRQQKWLLLPQEYLHAV